MADSRCLSVSEPLCFAISRYGKLSEKVVKQVLNDFYTAEQLFIAKNRLSEDIGSLQLDTWPRPGQHRNSDKQASLEVDDIYSLIGFLDEQLLLDKMPIYVCENIDRIPSVRWMDGDFQMIIAKLAKVQQDNSDIYERIDKMGGVIEAQVQQINTQTQTIIDLKHQHDNVLEAQNARWTQFEMNLEKGLDICCKNSVDRCVSELRHTIAHTHDIHFPPVESRQSTATTDQSTSTARPATITTTTQDNRMQWDVIQESDSARLVVQPPYSHVLIQPPPAPTQQHSQQQTRTGNTQRHHTGTQPQRQLQQRRVERHAFVVDQPTAVEYRSQSNTVHPLNIRSSTFNRNRINYSSTQSTAAESDDDGGEFQEYHGRQYRRHAKRRRAASSEQPSEQQPRFKLVGRANTNNSRLKAFGQLVDKRVFSVSNVDTSYTVDDIKGFLSYIGIRVVTVHDAKSKFDGKSFRVCIVAEDSEKFAQPDIWPENVIIRPWFFKEKRENV